MSAEQIAEIIRAHQPTTGMSVASGVTCRCGYWNGEERAGVNRPVGYQGLQWHQAQELSAAGFGPVKEAKAEALEEVADHLDQPRIVWWGDQGVTVGDSSDNPRTFTKLSDWIRGRARAEGGIA